MRNGGVGQKISIGSGAGWCLRCRLLVQRGAWLLLLMVGMAVCAAPVLAQGGPSPVVVSAIVERELAADQTFVATVFPLRRSLIGSAVDGRVLEFLVDAGEPVTANQPLAQLRTNTLELELAAAEADLTLREKELEELQNGARPEEVAQAKARVAAAEALLEYSKARFERTSRLYEAGQILSREELDQARSNYVHAEQSLVEARKAEELVVAGPREEKKAQAEARVLVQQEIVNQIKDRIEKHTLRAPFDGFVVDEHTEVGAWVKQGDPVAEVVYLEKVELEVYVPESSVPFIRRGQSTKVTLGALPDQLFTGAVARVVPQADVRTRTFPVKVHVENPRQTDGDHAIKAGMLARVTLPIGQRQSSLLVHKDALVLGGRQPMVYVVDKNQVRAVPVEHGVADGAMIAVRGDLQAGQRVVVRGNERLRPGQEVVVTGTLEPEMSSAAATTLTGE